MKFFGVFIAGILCSTTASALDLKFRMQEIDTTLKVGYGVVIADVNGDGKPDIVVCDARRVVWYENPTWKRRIIIEDQTPPDNVCIAPCDIDGDGKIDFFLGADWGRMDTTKGGTIHWLRRGKSLDEKWEVFKIGEEPTVHRMRVEGRVLVVAPLMGRDSTKEKNWLDGRPVRILKFWIPQHPVADPWKPEVFEESLHVVHNLWIDSPETSRVPCHFPQVSMYFASFDGVSEMDLFSIRGNIQPPTIRRISEGNQSTPQNNRGASEVKVGILNYQSKFVTTIEPWHGHEVVVYTPADTPGAKMIRRVIDDKLRWGHALWCADLIGDVDGKCQIIVGVRDDLSMTPGERRGIRVYKKLGFDGEKWDRQIVDDGGIACEDLVVHDLDGDGRPDIIATGRQTGNVRIYWNRKE